MMTHKISKAFPIIVASILGITFSFAALQFQPNSPRNSFRKNDHKVDFQDSTNAFPTIMVDNERQISTPLGMNRLKVDVQVVGNIAVTTLDMTFFNKEARILEGELYFPLAAGKTVSRFAMEVDGKLREGVVVEKTQGRVAFESTVRQGIDPGLIEWSKGNNFKARIYPIPAKATKRIVVTYTQELAENSGEFEYYLPMKFKDLLESLDITISVLQQKESPILHENDLHCFRFDRNNEGYYAAMHLEETYAKQPLKIVIPFRAQEKTMIEQAGDSTNYFYTIVHPRVGERRKQLPKSLTLVYDVSGSAANRDTEKENSLLKQYLLATGVETVQLVTFSNEIHSNEMIELAYHDSQNVIDRLATIEYDGATQLGCIDFNELKGEEIILVSDCLGNFGKAEFSASKRPVCVWNSNVIADPSNAQYIADKTNGEFVDLTTLNNQQALDKMTLQQVRFLGIAENPNVTLTSERATGFTSYFGVAGISKSVTEKIELKFGYGNEVTETIMVDLQQSMVSDYKGIVKNIWAQKRIAELDLRYERNKNEINRLGKKYGVVTRNTSLIVLDRLEDYVTHRITPPEELLAEYQKRIATIQEDEKKSFDNHLEEVVNSFNERKNWWKTVFKPKPITKEKLIAYTEPVVVNDQVYTYSNQSPASTLYDVQREETQSERKRITRADSTDKAKGAIKLADWDPDTPYLKKLKETQKTQWYSTYLELKATYSNQPGFFIDVADFFIKNKEPKTALRILSNIAEMQLENPQLLRILGHRLEQLGYYQLSISVFQEVKTMRPEEPQSYRDLGLAYASNKEDQRAIDELYYAVTHNWDGRFSEVESLIAYEMNTIIANSTQQLNISHIDKRLIAHMPVDMRVLITWDSDNCDIDLWVTDPRGEKCYYSNKLTSAGGRISNDFTQGYGPEEFLIKKAIPGNYKIQANYYGSTAQTLTGTATVQVQMITNYGRKSQQLKSVTRRLDTEKEILDLATFTFKTN
ncbi:MAG: VIT domain-containing protein [Fluviicola sp.]|nr:VIT domain-containing protein [Fluviicola sp.]